MGCCLSTTAATKTNHHQLDDSKTKMDGRDAPPSTTPVFEEETVKEVLSETHILPKKPPPSTPTLITRGDTQQILQSQEEVNSKNADRGGALMKNTMEENQGSEVSEMYSYSESFSAATTATVTDNKRDEIGIDDGKVTQIVKRSPAATKRVPRKRPSTSSGGIAGKDKGIRPLARRSVVPSPEKKCQLPSRNTTTTQRHRNVGPSSVRRELPARRSRSPAMRGESGRGNVGEKRPAENSGDRIVVNSAKNEGKVNVEKADDGGVRPVPETSESLENPLVSLECFIFL